MSRDELKGECLTWMKIRKSLPVEAEKAVGIAAISK